MNFFFCLGPTNRNGFYYLKRRQEINNFIWFMSYGHLHFLNGDLDLVFSNSNLLGHLLVRHLTNGFFEFFCYRPSFDTPDWLQVLFSYSHVHHINMVIGHVGHVCLRLHLWKHLPKMFFDIRVSHADQSTRIRLCAWTQVLNRVAFNPAGDALSRMIT